MLQIVVPPIMTLEASFTVDFFLNMLQVLRSSVCPYWQVEKIAKDKITKRRCKVMKLNSYG
jgi:hypothetical protein